ncbi:ABC transporter substrate-binding protein [Motiliproteus sp. MSK22-1]|uniref:substrate-binding periplasmic protein n=1 Tax=Motiliproteus sp. MSK22-1 TaxID=1897630 RepID=UPI0009775023|nr:transporter substrate-binding domain-containing protein [Motiliproteus sp. MSK22-1]OMH25655.1 hypothetical protein BGP75_24230 [Motiliproteus sp. MSK22-1]
MHSVAYKLLLSIFVFFVCARAAAEEDGRLRWLSEHYAPYNYVDDKGQPQGITVDVLKALWNKLEVPERLRKIEFMPWARGYAVVQRAPDTVLFSTTYTPAREKIFNFVGPVVENKIVILSRKQDRLQIASDPDLKGLIIGVVREDIGEQIIIEKGVDRSSIVASNLASNLVQLLNRKRVDAIAYSYDVAVWNMLKLGIDPREFEISYLLLGGEMGFAFHKNTNPILLQRFQKALDDLKIDGTVEQIRRTYLESSR